MKISLTVAIFLGLTSAVRIQHHSHHHHSSHHQKHSKDGSEDSWVDDCQPGRNPFIAGNGNAGTVTSYPGVGIECQGFSQKKKASLAQRKETPKKGNKDAWIDDCSKDRVMDGAYGSGTQGAPGATASGSFDKVGVECQGFAQKKSHSLAQYKGDTDAWIDPCDAERDVSAAKNPSGAGTWEETNKGSYPAVGVECQGFAQKKSQSMAQYKGDTDAWIDDCSPDRVMNGDYGSGTQGAPGALPNGSFDKVGVECQGFSQKKSHSLAQSRDGSEDEWVDPCDPNRDVSAQINPSGAGTYDGPPNHGSYPAVGVECQGFAQIKRHSLVQSRDGSEDEWIDPCDANRDVSAQTNPSGAGTYEATNAGSYPAVGVECQGFAQRKSIHNLVQSRDGSEDEWIDPCDANRDVSAQTNPSGAGTYETGNGGSYPAVGVECQGFAQRKSIHSLSQYKGDTDAWVDPCDANRDVSAQTNPSGAGTYDTTNAGSYPGVGVECQGFAQRKRHSLVQSRDGSDDAWVDPCDANRDVSAQTNPSGAGTYEEGNGGSFPGVGVECQGFAQRRSKDGSEDAWVDDCAPGRNPFKAGNGNAGTVTSYPGVGIECQGFSQKKKASLAQSRDGSDDAWVDPCDANRDVSAQTNPSGAGTYEEGNGGSFPGVGVECQGFAQSEHKHKHKKHHKKHHKLFKKTRDCDDDWPECNGTNGTPGVDCCDE